MNNLKKLRTDAGLTQVQLAEKSGICRATIADIESGRDTCLSKTLIALAEALGTTIDKLVDA